jgi:phosphopantothenoylcysteine decarboxylase/phosphopantothenate--cysteine ligase
VVEPDAGEMACGTFGPGRLSEPDSIVAAALAVLAEAERNNAHEPTDGGEADKLFAAHKQDLSGERLLITAGATREAIDPVRFLSNRSSGRMGFALAEAARARGAEVTIVAGVTTALAPAGVTLVQALSAEEMRAAVMNEMAAATIFIAAAAVSDYRPARLEAIKIKKRDAPLTLKLEPTPDILAEVAAHRRNGLLVVGFAAETNDVLNYARAKLARKKLDAIVANDITRDGAGFDTETNAVTILTRTSDAPVELPLMSKLEVAHRILDEVARLRSDTPAASTHR